MMDIKSIHICPVFGETASIVIRLVGEDGSEFQHVRSAELLIADIALFLSELQVMLAKVARKEKLN